ncbi:hypothetical protein ACFL3J_00075 [Candidatus Omnitrophota bacterium]
MKIKLKAASILVILGAILFLTGCIEVTEEVWVNPDGSGRFRFDIAVLSEEIPEEEGLNHLESLGRFRQKMFVDLETKKQKLEKLEFVESVEISKTYNDTKDHYVYNIHVSDIYKINDVFREIYDGLISDELVWKIDIKRRWNGDILFTQTFTNNESLEAMKASPEDVVPLEPGSGTSDKRCYTIIIRSPRIVTSNGKISAKGTEAEWKIPFDELDEADLYRAEFTAVVKGQSPTLLFAILLIFGIIFITVLYLTFKKRRNTLS